MQKIACFNQNNLIYFKKAHYLFKKKVFSFTSHFNNKINKNDKIVKMSHKESIFYYFWRFLLYFGLYTRRFIEID